MLRSIAPALSRHLEDLRTAGAVVMEIWFTPAAHDLLLREIRESRSPAAILTTGDITCFEGVPVLRKRVEEMGKLDIAVVVSQYAPLPIDVRAAALDWAGGCSLVVSEIERKG
jgi:hypothetical protein